MAGAFVLLLALVAFGCTSGTAAPGTSTSTLPSTVVTTTVAPLRVGGTTEAGIVGSVERIPVLPEARGATTVTLPPVGTPGYRHVVMIGFRQFGSGKELVLIPGEGATMSWWSPAVLDELATHYRVTVFDLPGTGYSGPSPATFGISYLADVTAGLISELGISSPAVVGWGLGGQVALALAERHRRLASSLILVNTGLPLAGSTAPTRSSTALADPAAGTAAVAAGLFPRSARAARERWIAAVESQVPDDVVGPSLRTESSLESSLWRARTPAIAKTERSLPVLVVDATADAVFPPDDSTRLAAHLPGSQRYVWRHGGYACFAEDPPRFLRVLSSFTG